MTERTPWWKAFLPKKKAAKDQAFDVNFDPWAKSSPAASKASQPVSNNSSSLLSDETFDDSRLDSVFNEQTCRRNMNISRSGRFKEKKKIRTTIPIEQKEKENATSGREDARWQQGVKSRAIKDCFTEMLEDGGEEEIKVYEDVSLSWSMPGILLIFLFFLLFLYVGDNEDDEHSSFSPILEKKDDFRHLLMHFARKPKKQCQQYYT